MSDLFIATTKVPVVTVAEITSKITVNTQNWKEMRQEVHNALPISVADSCVSERASLVGGLLHGFKARTR